METNSEKQVLLVVDDTPENIDSLAGVLRRDFTVKAALSGARALKIAVETPRPDMVLLDVMMPGMDGYEVCRNLKANPLTAGIPVIFVTAKGEEEDEKLGLTLGAVDYISKPIKPAIVQARVRTHLALHHQSLVLEDKVRARTQELQQTRLEIIRRLGRAAEYKDNETGLHVVRMSHYARLIAEDAEGGSDWANLLFDAAPMHDIGKIGIADCVLLKPGKLDDDEWAVMRTHPEIGAAIIGEHPSALLTLARDVALTHHEKWDGSGYPRGLRGPEIPLAGRIVAIADVFDALTTVRPYKKAWHVNDAVKYLDDNTGAHFDPALMPTFHRLLPEILKIKERHAEPG